MELVNDFSAIAAQLEAYDAKVGASMDFRVYINKGVATYVFMAPSVDENLSFEFNSGQTMVEWLVDVNSDADPVGSAFKRKRLEILQQEKAVRDAEIIALEAYVVKL
jgi:hypothetical protein